MHLASVVFDFPSNCTLMCCLSMPSDTLDSLIDAASFSNKICQVVGDASGSTIINHEICCIGLKSRLSCSWHGVQACWFAHLAGPFALQLCGAHDHVIHHCPLPPQLAAIDSLGCRRPPSFSCYTQSLHKHVCLSPYPVSNWD